LIDQAVDHSRHHSTKADAQSQQHRQKQKGQPQTAVKTKATNKNQSGSRARFAQRFLNLLSGKTAKPYYNENTFFLWEPCSRSHAEVVPGYCKLLLDAGYDVSVLIQPKRIDEGLFCNFTHERLHINRLSKRATLKFFKENGLASSSGILVTTVGKLTPNADYDHARGLFAPLNQNQRVLLVEHDIKNGVDLGTLTRDIITLRETDYKNSITTPVNPHYFGELGKHQKGARTIFATVGAIRDKRRNSDLLISAVEGLHQKGVSNFTVLVIGKNNPSTIPRHLQQYFLHLGRLPFRELYKQMQCCDFLLPLLDPNNPSHRRYITTGTSGTFQLALGFHKPLILEQSFAPINKLNKSNSIVYEGNNNFRFAMEQAIALKPDQYESLQKAVAETARSIYAESLSNLKSLI
jgi:hypothetical protein